MPRISALQARPGGDRTTVYVDGEPIGCVEAAFLYQAGLAVGAELSESELEALRERAVEEAAFRRALSWLTVRARTRVELATRLEQAGYGTSTCRRVLERLEALGYIDDQAFAETFVQSRRARRALGRNRLRYELRQKGIAAELIDQVLADRCDEAAELEAACRLIASRRPEAGVPLRRLVGFLQRRGFSDEVIRRALRQQGLWRE